MAQTVIMPKAGITVEECVITEWQKKKGDHVNVGDVLFTYETDKASFECESTAEGELLEIFYQDGDEVPVLVPVCAVGQPGDSIEGLKDGTAAPACGAAQARCGSTRRRQRRSSGGRRQRGTDGHYAESGNHRRRVHDHRVAEEKGRSCQYRRCALYL